VRSRKTELASAVDVDDAEADGDAAGDPVAVVAELEAAEVAEGDCTGEPEAVVPEAEAEAETLAPTDAVAVDESSSSPPHAAMSTAASRRDGATKRRGSCISVSVVRLPHHSRRTATKGQEAQT